MVDADSSASIGLPLCTSSTVSVSRVTMLSPEQSPSIPSIRLKALITTMTMSTVSGVDIQSGMAYIPKFLPG